MDFQEIEACQACGDWERSGHILGQAAQQLERAGADFLVLCTNTMHKVAPAIEEAVHIPLLHIAQATIQELQKYGIHQVALLGTKYTMQQDFYKQQILDAGIEVVIPNDTDMQTINRVIFQELCLGICSPASKGEYLRIIGDLQTQGAQGVILGCTEIGLLISQEDTTLPLFDTAQIHALHAAYFALEK